MGYPVDKNGEPCSAFHTGIDDDGTRAGKSADAAVRRCSSCGRRVLSDDKLCARCRILKEATPVVPKEQVNHPDHYGGADNPYEVVKVAEAWGMDADAYLFNALKYIARAGKKSEDRVIDLQKAAWYIERRIAREKAR